MHNPAHGEEQLHKTVHAKLHWLENSLENSLDLDDTKLTEPVMHPHGKQGHTTLGRVCPAGPGR